MRLSGHCVRRSQEEYSSLASERISFPFDGFVFATLIRGTRARGRVRRGKKGGNGSGGFDVGEML